VPQLDPAIDLLVLTDHGLYCPAGGFYIDPWKPVDQAVITHAHADHARPGSRRYVCAESGKAVLAQRVQKDAVIDTLAFGEPRQLGDVLISLHPAGHLLGSAQIRIEHRGHVTVFTGDYKTDADASCEAFELVPCDTFITESTFGLPIYRWPPPEVVFEEINTWWRHNQRQGRNALIIAYALGKAQRVLAGVDRSIGPILVHGSVTKFVEVYRDAGIDLPEVIHATKETIRQHKGRALIVAPGSVIGSPWARRLNPVSAAMASGWMRVRGRRRNHALDRGFVLSDHADWPALMDTIQQTGAARVGVTHGYTEPVVRLLRDRGVAAFALATRYTGESIDGPDDDGADGLGGAGVPGEGSDAA